ncbi:hypothetical protein B0H10DRAFT_2071080 [Mycena sp. CBHHK59/15]|nr:hypothetical protein B0H10DRAFT_2071080 [Mycena sp. CBHHK59/15]
MSSTASKRISSSSSSRPAAQTACPARCALGFCDLQQSSPLDSCGQGPSRPTHSVQFVNNCGFGIPSLVQFSDGKILTGPLSNYTGDSVRAIGFLDQGLCGSTSNLNCTSLDINLGASERNTSYIAVLHAPFSVPVSYTFSQGCSTSGLCLDQTCPRDPLECNAPDANVFVTFCPAAASSPHPPTTSFPISSTTLPPLPTPASLPAESTSSISPPTATTLSARANTSTGKLLGAELAGSLGGALFLLLLILAFLWVRRLNAERAEARMPQRQIPFVVNPTWVLPSPTTPGAQSSSHLSLPDRARPRTIPVVLHQVSLPNLASQYRTRVPRPRASTVGSPWLARTESRGRSTSEAAGSMRSDGESSVWRPRIDVLGSRYHAENSGPVQSQPWNDSFWAP